MEPMLSFPLLFDVFMIPFAPHLLYPQVLDDGDPDERALGLFFGLVWLGRCHGRTG